MQAGAYQNGTWVVGVAKCGREEGCDLLGQSAIIAPSGEIAAMCTTLGDEVATARCDLDAARSYKDTVFNFARHRPPPGALPDDRRAHRGRAARVVGAGG